ILGFTFKENCHDTRNSKIIDIVRELREYGIEPLITDPVADRAEAEREYGITMTEQSEIREMDAVILAVAHTQYQELTMDEIGAMYAREHEKKVFSDIKGLFDRKAYEVAGYLYWRL
ncbi:MAG: nucleotide sugar dehydrogenase, partial [Lachnospiraceae bacterium]|nr:nucleotide sugar dehydrogenase [Lachnospiraceae bacterium]